MENTALYDVLISETSSEITTAVLESGQLAEYYVYSKRKDDINYGYER